MQIQRSREYVFFIKSNPGVFNCMYICRDSKTKFSIVVTVYLRRARYFYSCECSKSNSESSIMRHNEPGMSNIDNYPNRGIYSDSE